MVFYIDLRNYYIVIIIIIIIANSVLNIKIKINIFLINLLMKYRIVQKKIIIKVLDFTMKTIIFITTIIDYFHQDHLFK